MFDVGDRVKWEGWGESTNWEYGIIISVGTSRACILNDDNEIVFKYLELIFKY